MLKYLSLCLCFLSSTAVAQPKIINYVTPSQQELSEPQGNVQNIVIEDDDFFSDMDKLAAEHGDDHAMGTLANTCLHKKDFECAYKWAGIALRGSYWRSQGMTDKIKNIQEEAKGNLSEQQINDLDALIKNFSPKR